MKKIITAIGNEILNKKLKKENDFEVIIEDIQYKEGIIEYLEKENNIDILIISELLPGNVELKELIEKIKNINSNIEIIIFLENKNTELENYLYAKGIYNIFYNNQIEIEEIIKIINNKNIEINNELKEIKQMLLEKQKNKVNNKKIILNKLINIFNKKQKYDLKEEKIISVTGTNGVGKSIFTINLANSLSNSKNKILIIDFDILNNSLHTILGIKKYSQKIRNKIKNNNLLKEIKIEELIIKINSKIDLVSGINLLFDSKYKISSEKVKNILSKLKEKYEIIIIDTSSECFFDYTKEIIKNSNLNIFILEANLLEIKKAKNLLNIYINNWEIPQESINILFNKYNENSIDISILKKIFSGFNILGKLSFNPQYNLIINKNNINKLNIILKNEYLKINKNLIKINKKGEF
ncbi:MAG: AAA family ATPase [Clostridia bacterium]|nr:AAA family ATPase [Clostridia bacterium]